MTSRMPRSAAGGSRASAAKTARSAQPGLGHLAAQHHHLTPQHQDLHIVGRLTAAQQEQPARHPDHDQIQQTDRYERRSCPNSPTTPNHSSQGLRHVLKQYRLAARSGTGPLHQQQGGVIAKAAGLMV